MGAADYLVKGQLTPAKLKSEVNRAIAEHQLSLQHQEALLKLQLATVASGLGMWFWDIREDKLEWTQQCKTLFGLEPDADISYKKFLQLLHPEDRDRTTHSIKAALANRTEYSVEYRVIWSDESIHWLVAKGRGFYNQAGEPNRMMGTVQDITQSKQLEAELVKTNNILRSIISDTCDLIYVKDLQGRYLMSNQAAAEWLGRRVEEMLGQDDTKFFAPEIAQSIRELDSQVITEGKFFSYEEVIPYRETSRSLLTNKYPWRDATGKILGVIGISRDITLLKESQRQLQENEQLLRLALSSANAGSWDWEIATGKIIWSPENYELYGLDPQQGSPEYQNWSERPRRETTGLPLTSSNQLHPEDRERVQQEVQKVIDQKLPKFNAEFRIIHPQQGVRWLLGMGNVTLNDQGEPIRMSGINLDITERKQIEDKLRRSEEQLRRILDSLYSFVGVLTPDGVLIEANHTVLKAADLEPKDVLGKPFAQAYWWSYDPKIQAQLNAAVQRAANGEIVRYDVKIRLSESNFILIDFSIVPLFNANGQLEYLIPSGIDITDREASKQALQQSEDQLRLITEVIPQQVWTALPNGEIDYINQRWQEYTGVPLEAMQGLGWSTIVHPDDLERVSQNWTQAIETGQKYNIEARLRRSDGNYHWFLGRARPLKNPQGEIIKWYGTNTDITRIKELEEKLRQRTEELVKANQLKDEFLAIVSHELRTPLNPILGWSQLLAAGRLSTEKTALGIEIIERNAKLQAQIINDLLDVSRILRGKLNFQLTALNLEFVIRAALDTVKLAAEAKSITIKTVFEPNVGQVLGDEGRLQQIAWNLLSNAIKFTPEGGEVVVTLKRIGTQVQIQVQDTGQGIKPEFLPYVFDRFRQAESATTRKFGGLGLGLAIVRHLAELHGGTVAVTSPGVGQGATFRVKFPLVDSAKTKQVTNLPIEESVKPNCFNGLQVLIVDDEIDSRDILTFVLEQEGAAVTAVASAQEALAALDKFTPNLIISDIGMPEADGYTLMTQIRQLSQGENLPAIALTAYAGEVDRQRALNAGFQQHLTKPINISLLLTTITKLINSNQKK